VVPSTLALGVLLSTDVLLVKHFFSTQLAGEYSAVAALGRALFWGATGVAAVLFPKIVARKVRGESGSHLIAASVALVALGGLLGFGLLSISSRALIVAFSGSGYAAAAGYLPWYAIGMTLLGGVAVLIATHQTTGKPDFLAVLLPLTLVEPILIVAFHQNLLQVVQVVDLSMALVFGGLEALYLVEQRGREAPPTAIPLGQPTASPVPQLQVNR
jgi:O-antigen/teichoic acid export membrane protein